MPDLLKVNDAFCRLLGFEKSEMEGSTVLDFTYPDDIEQSILVHKAVINDENLSLWIEKRYMRKDGRVIWCEVSSSPVLDSKGCPIYTVAHIQDITERKRAEEALRRSEAKYRQITETAREGIWLIGVDGRTVYVNQKVSEMLGYSAEEIIGQLPQKFLAPEFITVLDEKLSEHKQGVKQVIDYKFIRKDGSELWCILSTSPLLDDDGKYAGSLDMLTDITERKKAEEELRKSENRFRVMFEGHGAPMLLIEPNSGQIIDANEAAARFYEYSREQLRAMCVDQINQLPPEEVAAERHKAVERGKNMFVFTHRLASGDVRLVEVYSSPVTIQGRPMLFSIIHDITQRKKAEEALQKTNETLEEKVKGRTVELEKAYNSLKESEKGLAEAQKIAHLGSWDWDLTTSEIWWSDEIYRIFGLDPQELAPDYNEFLNYVHPDDRDYMDKTVKRAINGESYTY